MPATLDRPGKEGPMSLPLQTLSENSIREFVQLFKLLADETRLQILHFLHQTDELNVLELCKLLKQRQPSVSHHLALLRVAGLIDMRRDGKHNFYRLVRRRFEQLIETVRGTAPTASFRICFENFELRYAPIGEQPTSETRTA